jgi:hypothetical protein
LKTFRCPDCDPEGFKASLVEAYGEPLRVGGCDMYSDPRMPTWAVLQPAEFARSFCPTHRRDPIGTQALAHSPSGLRMPVNKG